MGMFGKSILRGAGSEIGRSVARTVINSVAKGADAAPISVHGQPQSINPPRVQPTAKTEVEKILEKPFPKRPSTGLSRASSVIRELDKMFDLQDTIDPSEIILLVNQYGQDISSYIDDVRDLIEDVSKESELKSNLGKLDKIENRFKKVLSEKVSNWVSTVETTVLNVNLEELKARLLTEASAKRRRFFLTRALLFVTFSLIVVAGVSIFFIPLLFISYKLVKGIKNTEKASALAEYTSVKNTKEKYRRMVEDLRELIIQ